jgi:predicted ATP-dependent protease
MLNNEVIQAVKEQKFHIYGVEVVDDALAILTGKDAGKLNSKGDYPKRSVNGLAVKYLQYLSDIVNGHQDD